MRRKKYTLVLAAAALAVLLCAGTYKFISDVSAQLWNNSISTITESTQQGANALRIQLQRDFDALRLMAERLSGFSASQAEPIDEALYIYSTLQPSTIVYPIGDGTVPGISERDLYVIEALAATGGDEGLLPPHISSVTGQNVFNAYVRAAFADGGECYFVKEYCVDETANQFSLSFYNNTGFSYLTDQNGTVLVRSSHVNSNKTLQNLFDMLNQDKNDPSVVETFRQALLDLKSGWARFQYNGGTAVFCYTPLLSDSGWYLVSIVPEQVITAQTRNILIRALLLLGGVLLGISVILAVYLYTSRKTRRKLENQAAFITHLYNSIPEGIALITVERPYRCLQINREGLRLLGCQEDAPLESSLDGETLKNTCSILEQAAKDGCKHNLVSRVMRPDGSLFWASGIVERIVDANGAPVLAATFRDITNEKLAEEEREREKLMERRSLISAISSAHPMIMSLNLTRDQVNVLYSSPTIRVELSAEDTCSSIFHACEALVHPDCLQEYCGRLAPQSLLQRLGRETGEVYLEARARFTDGLYHWFSIQVLYVENPFSEDCTAILLARCVDEQKNDEVQRRQALQTALDAANAASQAKGEFLSNMSHDIRTPLNAIVGMTAIAKNHLSKPERISDCLGKIELSSAHLLSLINDVLDMSKIESGKLSLRMEPIQLTEFFSNVLELVEPQARDKGLDLEVHVSPMEHTQVIGDPLRIRQVLLNIISNAIKYTPAGGRVRLELTETGSLQEGCGSYQFRCTDTGLGMDEAFLQKLFLPFERSRNSTASQIAGTGLGMAITKNLLDIMGGAIHVESAPGTGSTFTVILHLKSQENGSAPPPTQAELIHAKEAPDLSGGRLLLVEDNGLNLEIARELIGITGVQIEEAHNGAQAVERVRQSPPGYYSLVLMDVQMPIMDGYEATRRIRALDRPDAAVLPIVAMTANAFSEDIDTAARAGMNGHISKPIDLNVVYALLREYLA